MSKSARRRQHSRPTGPRVQRPSSTPPLKAVEPERLLLEQIADGELDPHLRALARAIDARLSLLHTVRSVTALAMLNIGDRVRFNHHVRPRYLHGIQGTILELGDDSATICTDGPIGRFTSGEIRCAPLALDRLDRTHSHWSEAHPT